MQSSEHVQPSREAGRLVAENVKLVERLSRLGPAFATIARELAEARRENAALRRENERLQLLAGDGAGQVRSRFRSTGAAEAGAPEPGRL